MALVFNRVVLGSGSGNSKRQDFTFSGDMDYVDEGNGNWYAILKTSGTINFNKLGNVKNGIDVLAVAGGKTGGRGGEVVQGTFANIVKDKSYNVTVGNADENSVAFGVTARTGYGSAVGSKGHVYVNEASNGYYYVTSQANGGNGADGIDPWNVGIKFGAGAGGAGTAFQMGVQIFSVPGGLPGKDTGDNTGCAGYSGAVLIRNRRF